MKRAATRPSLTYRLSSYLEMVSHCLLDSDKYGAFQLTPTWDAAAGCKTAQLQCGSSATGCPIIHAAVMQPLCFGVVPGNKGHEKLAYLLLVLLLSYVGYKLLASNKGSLFIYQPNLSVLPDMSPMQILFPAQRTHPICRKHSGMCLDTLIPMQQATTLLFSIKQLAKNLRQL